MDSEYTVVRTKLLPPVSRSGQVHRRRLLRLLSREQARGLTLITAPAGFGKTTLLGQWYETLIDAGVRACWLSLDHQDGEPARFLHHLVAALRSAVPGIGAGALRYIDSSAQPEITRSLGALINDIADSGYPMALFLDDFHRAESDGVAEFMELFVNLAPQTLRVVIAGRLLPRLPLASMRARDEVRMLDAGELRFDSEESAAFLGQIEYLDPGGFDAHVLHERTEGWPAGLQLASLSLRNPAGRSDFMESFSGSIRDIADYLASEVLHMQSTTTRDFLLRTAVLGRMNGSVCDILTGHQDSQATLERLERENLFVIPLDQGRNWYRYHHLFHDFLRDQLRRVYPGELVELYKRSARWFAAQGLLDEAVEYALLSGDMELLVGIVEAAIDEAIGAGRMPLVYQWINRIPPAERCRHPRLLAAQGTVLYHMNRPVEAREVLELLEARLAAGAPDADGTLAQLARTIRAGIAMAQDDVGNVLAPLAGDFDGAAEFVLGIVHNLRGYARSCLGDDQRAFESLEAARRHHTAAGSAFGVVYADCFRALLDFERGDLHAALARFERRESGTDAPDETYVAPVPDLIRGLVLYEWNRLEEAEGLLTRNLPIVEEVGHLGIIVRGYLTLARLHAGRGETEAAFDLLERPLALVARGSPAHGRARLRVESERVRLLLGQGRLAAALNAGARAGIEAAPGGAAAVPCAPEGVADAALRVLTRARLLHARGDGPEAVVVLHAQERRLAAAGRDLPLIPCTLLQARALTGRDEAAADACLARALRHAGTAGTVRLLLDEHPEVPELLERFRARHPDEEAGRFASRVLAAARRGAPVTPPAPLAEPLSTREVEVLRLLAAGSANPEIAERLAISGNTVKWHVKNIFGKLGVRNRTAAVVAAQRYALLD